MQDDLMSILVVNPIVNQVCQYSKTFKCSYKYFWLFFYQYVLLMNTLPQTVRETALSSSSDVTCAYLFPVDY